MSLLVTLPVSCDRVWGTSLVSSFTPRASLRRLASISGKKASICPKVNAFFSAEDDPIVKEAIKEPVAFFGGVFAGLLRLDLKEDPLRDWVARTSEAAGQEKIEGPEVEEESPQEIQIE